MRADPQARFGVGLPARDTLRVCVARIRSRNYLKLEEAHPEAKAWADRMVPNFMHAPGSAISPPDMAGSAELTRWPN